MTDFSLFRDDVPPFHLPAYTETEADPDNQAPSLPLKFSMNQRTTLRWLFEDDISGYLQNGWRAAGLWRMKLTEYGEERAVEILRNLCLSVSTLSYAGGFTGANGYTFQEAVIDAHEAIQLAGRLSADSLIIVSGPRAGHTWNHAREILTDALLHLAVFAEEHDVNLALLPMRPKYAHDWTFLTSLDEAMEIVDLCHHPKIGLAFDTYQLADEPHLLDRIPEIAPVVKTVQLSDWMQADHSPTANDRCLPGDGELPLAEMMGSLWESGYRGYFDVDVWSDRGWKADYQRVLMDSRTRLSELCRVTVPASVKTV